jgi:hypothetical protein
MAPGAHVICNFLKHSQFDIRIRAIARKLQRGLTIALQATAGYKIAAVD